MVGMPFPNPTDPELRERMAFMDAAAAVASASSASTAVTHTSTSISGSGSGGPAVLPRSGGVSAGQQYYQDLCMKAGGYTAYSPSNFLSRSLHPDCTIPPSAMHRAAATLLQEQPRDMPGRDTRGGCRTAHCV